VSHRHRGDITLHTALRAAPLLLLLPLLLPLPPPLPCRSVSRRREPKEAAAVRLVNKLLLNLCVLNRAATR